jgi:peptidoglycan/LPS O-acetylase OafA/YrhL
VNASDNIGLVHRRAASAPGEMSQPKESVGHLPSLDMLRGVAALAVVMFHIAGEGFQQQLGVIPVGNAFRFGYAGLDLFFVLSGFIIFYVHGREIGRPDRLASYVWKRFSRIYPMYWIATLTYIAMALARHVDIEPHRAIASLLLIPDVRPIIAVAWTLSHEVLFYGVFALLLWAPKLGAVVAAVWLAGSLVFAGSSDPGLMFLFNIRHLEFLVGALAAFALRSGVVSRPAVLLGGGLSLCVIAAVLDVLKAALPEDAFIIAYGLGSGAVILGIATYDLAGRLRVPGVFRLLGAASYSVYLTHLMAFSVLSRLLMWLRVPTVLPPWLTLLLIAVLIAVAGVLVHLWVEKPVLRTLRGVRVSFATPVQRGLE